MSGPADLGEEMQYTKDLYVWNRRLIRAMAKLIAEVLLTLEFADVPHSEIDGLDAEVFIIMFSVLRTGVSTLSRQLTWMYYLFHEQKPNRDKERECTAKLHVRAQMQARKTPLLTFPLVSRCNRQK